MNQRFCNGMIHVIKPGDNLYQLSRRYRVPLALILRANPYVDVYNLRPGQEICIPMSRPGRPMPEPEPQEMQKEMEMDEMGECPDERCTYRSDGTKSLGKILEENGLSMTEFFERNDPNQVVIASDVMLDIPKKV
ncbi:MAG: LysM domain-containing protein [Eubacterium sp.]|nr:LysM domain-containing protein [Eubacterium sp.]